MTQLGLDYLKHVETKRANQAQEALKGREASVKENTLRLDSDKFTWNKSKEQAYLDLDSRKQDEVERHNAQQRELWSSQASAAEDQAMAAVRNAATNYLNYQNSVDKRLQDYDIAILQAALQTPWGSKVIADTFGVPVGVVAATRGASSTLEALGNIFKGGITYKIGSNQLLKGDLPYKIVR